MERRTCTELKLVGIDEPERSGDSQPQGERSEAKELPQRAELHRTMSDRVGARVIKVVEGAGQKEVETLWQTLPEEQREQVRAAAMDRGRSMIADTRASAPEADIVHDRYQISAEQNKAVDQVRRAGVLHQVEEAQGALADTDLREALHESGSESARAAQRLHAPHQQRDERGVQQRDPAAQSSGRAASAASTLTAAESFF